MVLILTCIATLIIYYAILLAASAKIDSLIPTSLQLQSDPDHPGTYTYTLPHCASNCQLDDELTVNHDGWNYMLDLSAWGTRLCGENARVVTYCAVDNSSPKSKTEENCQNLQSVMKGLRTVMEQEDHQNERREEEESGVLHNNKEEEEEEQTPRNVVITTEPSEYYVYDDEIIQKAPEKNNSKA